MNDCLFDLVPTMDTIPVATPDAADEQVGGALRVPGAVGRVVVDGTHLRNRSGRAHTVAEINPKHTKPQCQGHHLEMSLCPKVYHKDSDQTMSRPIAGNLWLPPASPAASSGPRSRCGDDICTGSEYHPDSDITGLYKCCQQAWGVLGDGIQTGYHRLDVDGVHILQNEAGRFKIWGDGFEAVSGGLNSVLDGAVDLRKTVVVLVTSMVEQLRMLCRCLSLPVSAFHRAPLCINASATDMGFASDGADLPLESKDRLDSLLNNDEHAKYHVSSQLTELTVLNDCLFELVPAMDTIPVSMKATMEGRPDEAPGLSGSCVVLGGKSPYFWNVQDRFPDASETLMKYLADLNWSRHKLIRGMRARWEVNQKETKQTENLDESITVVDSGYGTMDAKSVLSVSSFGATSNAEEVGRTRYPPLPIKLGRTEAFRCTICYQMLHGIDSKLKWRYALYGSDSNYMLIMPRMHIIRDIRPYCCTFADCSAAKQTYGSQTEWLAHEFKCHRFAYEWVCVKGCGQTFDRETDFHSHLRVQHTLGTLDIQGMGNKCRTHRAPEPDRQTDCPLCGKTVTETRATLRRHLGRHLEEIALASLPPELYWSDGGSEENETDNRPVANNDGGSLFGSHDVANIYNSELGLDKALGQHQREYEDCGKALGRPSLPSDKNTVARLDENAPYFGDLPPGKTAIRRFGEPHQGGSGTTTG